MSKFLKSIWEFPQKIGAQIVIRISKAVVYTQYEDATVYSWKFKNGLSLSNSIFVPFKQDRDPSSDYVQQYIKHEYGHSIQSKYLGWFYLLIIGIPSMIWNACCKAYRKKNGVSYYSFYTERWANILGGSTLE